MSVKHLIKARRPNGGTKRPITDHMQPGESGSHEDADGSPYDSPQLYPSEYIVSVDEQDANGVSQATQELAGTVLPKPYAQADLDNGVSKADLLDRALGASIGYTDADGLGLVPVYRLIPSVVEDVSAAVRGGWTRSSAARALNSSGVYPGVASDTPRLHYPLDGSGPGLLMEAEPRTNLWPNSTDFSSFNTSSTSQVNSILEGETGNKRTHDGSAGWMSERKGVGTTTASRETLYVIEEEVDQVITGLVLSDDTDGVKYANYRFNWANKTFSRLGGNNTKAFKRKLADQGPNGYPVWQLIVSGVPPNGSGNNRSVDVLLGGNIQAGATTIHHHTQFEEAPNASSPIVTGSSATTRGGDRISYPSTPWMNYDEGTFFLEFTWYNNYTNENPRLWAEDNNDFNHMILQHHNGGFGFNCGGDFINFGTVSPFTKYKYALSYGKSGTEDAMVNGGLYSASGSGGGAPVGNGERVAFVRMSRPGSYLIHRAVYFPQALPVTELETLTS